MSFTIEKIELKDSRGVKWSASRDYDGSYTCYRDGNGAFELTFEDGLISVRNDAPRADTYKNRREYLRALASGKHVNPIIATTTETEYPSLDRLLMWAVVQYKHRGWRTKDCFSERMTTKPAYPQLTSRQRAAVRLVLDFNNSIKATAAKYGCSPSTIRNWMDKYQEIGS